MRLIHVRLSNFRCYRYETDFDISDLTVIVGANEAGKSSLFDALAIFFDEAKIDSDDVCINSEHSEVKIICEFDSLPKSIVIDVDHPTTLADEYLLNENGHLEIHRVFDTGYKTPKDRGVFVRCLHPANDGVDDLLSLKITDLRKRAEELGIDTERVDLTISSAIRKGIWYSVEGLEMSPTLIQLDQEPAKKIWDQVKSYLPSYALFKSDRPSTDQDSEAQDPMKAAVKEALKEQEVELGAIAERVQQEVKTIAERTVEKLSEMHPELASELKPRFSTPNWASVFKISLAGDDDVPVNKRGSGVRRLILLNFFRAKAEQSAAQMNVPSVIYAIEEPETSQHPDNQRLLIKALQDLSQDPEYQILISTHTPTLARLVPVESLRYLQIGENGERQVNQGTEETYLQISKALGVLPDHDVSLFIGVEGPNDESFLKGISHILHAHGEDCIDLDVLEAQGRIVFFPFGGSNLAYWTSRLAKLNRPEIYIFDRDNPPSEEPRYASEAAEINAREGCKAFHTSKKEIENYIHPDAIRIARPNVDIEPNDFDDVPLMAAREIHDSSESEKAWFELTEEQQEKKKSRAKKWLNREAVLQMSPHLLDEADPEGDVRVWLKAIKDVIED
jgi:putative ATP-dependent endonuclease of OLD family